MNTAHRLIFATLVATLSLFSYPPATLAEEDVHVPGDDVAQKMTPRDARRQLRMPDAPNARAAQDKIYEWEAKKAKVK